MMPMTSPAASALSDATSMPTRLAGASNPWRHGQCGKEAVDDGRYTGQHFEQRFGDAAHARCRVLGKVDCRHQTDRHGDEHRDTGDQQRAGKQRHRAEAARRTDLVGTNGRLRAPVQCRTGTR